MKDFARTMLFAAACLGGAAILLAVIGVLAVGVTVSFGDIAQVITAIAAVGAVVMSMRNGHKIQEVHLSINSRMDQLLQATGDAQFAAGAREEKNSARADKPLEG